MIMIRLPPPVQAQLAAGGMRSLLLIVIQNAVWRYLSRLPHVFSYYHASLEPLWACSLTTFSSHPPLRANHQSP